MRDKRPKDLGLTSLRPPSWSRVLSITSTGMLSFSVLGCDPEEGASRDQSLTEAPVQHRPSSPTKPQGFRGEGDGTGNEVGKTEQALRYSSGGGFNPAIANFDRLIEMLRRNGMILETASELEAYEQAQAYLADRAAANKAKGLPLSRKARKMLQKQRSSQLERVRERRLHRGTFGERQANTPEAFKATSYRGTTIESQLLVLLAEFPDFCHNSIGPDETDMYYEDYTPEHYTELLFSPKTYLGPNEELLRTARDWYHEQSGGSYHIQGQVSDWIKVSEPAAYYGGNNPEGGGDSHPQQLVEETILHFAANTDIDLNQYDQKDPYDLDGDGDLLEADGIIDHLVVFHASVGEEAGGGSLGEDAIWSHRWSLPAPLPLPGTSTGLPYWEGKLTAFGYTMQPADAAIGVVVHEHGHDIGLPDEYDTQSTGRGEPIRLWSTMSYGTWGGMLPGSEPTGMSPYAREFLQANQGGRWLEGGSVNAMDLDENGVYVTLDEASSKGLNADYVRVDLPQKETFVVAPPSGSQVYFSGSGDNLANTMTYTLDLSAATTSATLQFQAWYDIEQDWDYAYVEVDDGTGPISIPGNLTTEANPNGTNEGHGITGVSDWTQGEFDLSAYVGQSVEVSIRYSTDAAVSQPGIYLDDIVFLADGNQIASDDAEVGNSIFDLDGFSASNGYKTSDHYYLLEWRTYAGVDSGLARTRTMGDQVMTYNRGMVVWYVDDSFSDNWVGLHPGEGFLGVVDADQRPLVWRSREDREFDSFANTYYQIRDAAFSRRRSPSLLIKSEENYVRDRSNRGRPTFRDWRSYWNDDVPDAGRLLDVYGLEFSVRYESRDRKVAMIRLSRRPGF